MNLSSISWDTPIWVALITGILFLIGNYLVHKFTQIRERENFEREITKLQIEDLLKQRADMETEKAELEAKFEEEEAGFEMAKAELEAEFESKKAKLIAEAEHLQVGSLILMEQLKDENPELLEEAHQRYLKKQKAEDHFKSLTDDQKDVSATSWYLEQSARILSQDRDIYKIDEEE